MKILNDPEFKRSQAVTSFKISGQKFERIACGYEREDFAEFAVDPECSNCGAPTGFLHVLPCDLEQCPRCEGQALSCSCVYEKRPNEL
jgi:hypothetical protein